MELISNKEQLIENIETLEDYITEGDDFEKNEAVALVKRGTCFVAYQIENELRFAPSRFIGYINNKLEKHTSSKNKDGRETNIAIIKIFKQNPQPNAEVEKHYFTYCKSLGIIPNAKGAFGVERKYWILNIEKDFKNNNLLDGEFPEGKIVERTHKARERNSKIINIAKQHFLEKEGKLFCQVCGFDFEKTYGELGKNFIEGHHTIAVCEMSSDHKTKIEDIAMLCSNCHKMIHKKRPWLTMTELNKVLKTKKYQPITNVTVAQPSKTFNNSPKT